MSDDELDPELLALANVMPDQPEDEKQTSAQPAPAASEEPDEAGRRQTSSPPAGTAVPTIEIEEPRKPLTPPTTAPKKSNARKITKPSTKSRSKMRSGEDGEESDANSLGSGAMSESDSDAGPKSSTKRAEHSSDGDDDVLFPVEGNFYSQRDKAEIMALPEIERERILAERAQEAEQKAQNAHLVRLLKERESGAAKLAEKRKRKADDDDTEEGSRKSRVAKGKANNTLDVYKRAREARQDQRRRDDARKATSGPSTSRPGDRLSEEGEESEVEWDDGRSRSPAKDKPQPELRDFERIRVGRSNFAKVCFYPGFETAIQGCFCRVNIGPERETGQNVYRLTQIKNFTTGKAYNMEGPNGKVFRTDQYAVLQHGKSEKSWPFIACSDGKISEAEFERYKRAQQTDNLRTPTLTYLTDKLQDIHNLLNHTWTDEEISEKLARQNRLMNSDRTRLQSEREAAIKEGDESAIARIDRQLTALDPMAATHASPGKTNPAAKPAVSDQDRLAALNRARRVANSDDVRRAQIAERKRERELQAAISRGEAKEDPFARVKTRAKFYFDANGGEAVLGAPKREREDLFGDGSDRSRAGTPSIGNAANKSGATPTPRAGTPSAVKPKSSTPVAPGGFRNRNMDDEILQSMDLGIEIDI